MSTGNPTFTASNQDNKIEDINATPAWKANMEELFTLEDALGVKGLEKVGGSFQEIQDNIDALSVYLSRNPSSGFPSNFVALLRGTIEKVKKESEKGMDSLKKVNKADQA